MSRTNGARTKSTEVEHAAVDVSEVSLDVAAGSVVTVNQR